MTPDYKPKNEIVTILIFLFLMIPLIAVGSNQDPVPSITIEAGEEVDVAESLLISSEAYSPNSVVTTLNDTVIENGNIWRVWYEDYRDRSKFERYVNAPLRNITEIILGVSFSVEEGPREVSIYCYNILNSTSGLSGQNKTLTLRVSPDEFSGYQYSELVERFKLTINVGGNYEEGITITGFWVQAVLNATLYPISIDVQRTNGVSLFSNPTTRDLQSFSLSSPRLELFDNNSTHIGRFTPTQSNDTMLLPAGYYNHSIKWSTFEIYSSFNISDEAIHLVWRIRTVRMDIKQIHHVFASYVDYSYSFGYNRYAIIAEPTFYFPPDGNWTITIQGGSISVQETISVGSNQNITVWIDPNTIVIGPLAFTPGKFVLLVSMLLMICIIGIAHITKKMSSTKLIPYILVAISYILPWVHYAYKTSFPATVPPYPYLIYYAESPGISSTSYSTNDSLAFVSRTYNEGFLLLYYTLLFMALAGFLLDEIEIKGVSEHATNLFAFSLLAIFVVEVAYAFHILSIASAENYLAVIPGIGPFVVIGSMIAWIIVHVQRKSKSTT